MTTKDKNPVPFLKASELIEKVYFTNNQEFNELSAACSELAITLYKEQLFSAKDSSTSINVIAKYRKLASRFEREFLRQEKKAIINDDEIIVTVHYACSELGAITVKNIKANTPHFYSLKHLYTDLLVQHRDKVLFKEIGNYELLCELELNPYNVEIWSFKLISFKPEEK